MKLTNILYAHNKSNQIKSNQIKSKFQLTNENLSQDASGKENPIRSRLIQGTLMYKQTYS